RSWQMNVTTARRGGEALEAMSRAAGDGAPFDLALLDFHMPDMDGVQLARAISATPKLRGTRMVMLTSSISQTTEARAAGIAALLTKPVRQSRLYDTIAAIMSGRD